MRKLIHLPFVPMIGMQIMWGNGELFGSPFQETPIQEVVWRPDNKCFVCWISRIEADIYNKTIATFVDILADLGWEILVPRAGWAWQE